MDETTASQEPAIPPRSVANGALIAAGVISAVTWFIGSNQTGGLGSSFPAVLGLTFAGLVARAILVLPGLLLVRLAARRQSFWWRLLRWTGVALTIKGGGLVGALLSLAVHMYAQPIAVAGGGISLARGGKPDGAV